MIQKPFSLILIFLIPCFVFAQQYLWPTNSSTKLSATFGEYRAGHFHAGIDIKTNNRNGYPCYAIESGYISRVITKPYGYGKAVYLKLDDGNIAVYGHLDGFAPELAAIVKKEQQKNGRYTLNKYFEKDELRVNKGDVIAYTGTTGTRHPHLHFEIRDANHNPVNPLRFEGLQMADKTPPKINRIAVVPASPTTLINNLPETFIAKPVLVRSGSYRINTPIIVTSNCAIEISTYDVVQGLWNKYGPANMRLFMDDSLIFEQKVEKFSYSNTGLIEIDRNYQLMAEGKGRFIRMWQYDENAAIPFHRGNSDGIITPDQKSAEIRLEVFDFNGNRSTVSFRLLKESMKIPKIYSVTEDSAHFNFTIKRDTSSALYKTVRLSWVTEAGTPVESAELTNFFRTDSTYHFSTPKKEGMILKIAGISNTTGQELYTFFNPGKIHQQNRVNLHHYHDAKNYITRLNFASAPLDYPALYLQSPMNFRSIPLLPVTPTEYVTAANSFRQWHNVFAVEVKNGDDTLLREKPSKELLFADDEKIFQKNDFTISFGSDLLYDTLMFSWDITPRPENNELFISDVITIDPTNKVLKNSAKLAIQYDSTVVNIKQVGVYSVFRGRTRFAGAKRDTIQKTISTTIGSFGQYALVRDNIPPVISSVYPRTGKYYKQSSVHRLSADIDDKMSGIAGDAGIEMRFDGKKVIAEWHPIHKTLTYEPERPLAKGRHSLAISITDNAGNRSEKKVEFFIVD